MKRILVVEDDVRVAQALRIRLQNAGYKVSLASNPASGTKLAVTEHPDLIITDLKLPTLHGLAFVEGLQQSGLEHIPFVVLTGSYGEGLWESAMSMGAAAYFEKPYDPEQLLNSVTQTINLRHPVPASRHTHN